MELYIKENRIKKRKDINVVADGMRIFNPTEEMLLQDGWEKYVPPTPKPIEIPIEEQYKRRVIMLIREQYSIDDELAILRQRDSKVEEFSTYNTFAEECKTRAREELGI